MNPLQDIPRFLLNTGVDLYILVLWLRFLLQAMGMDFYNPLSQFAVHATRALVDPVDRLFQRKQASGVINMRRFRAGRWCFGALVVIVLVKLLQITLISLLVYHQQPPVVLMLFVALLHFPSFGDAFSGLSGLLPLLVYFYYYAVIAGAILSWIAPHAPAVQMIFQIVEPLLAPCRRLLPAMGGLDLSPVLAIAGLWIAEYMLQWSAVQIAGILGL
jgi:YggT family protein